MCYLIEEVKFPKNIYKNKVGHSYLVIGKAKHTENDKTFVVCQNLKKPKEYWAIPIARFPEALNDVEEKTYPVNDYSSLKGKYRHFKNKEYTAICVAIEIEQNEKLMVYQAMYGNFEIWARPLPMFLGYKEENGAKIKRFIKMEETV